MRFSVGFPALIAPASLKLDYKSGEDLLQDSFPTLIAPASLKRLVRACGRRYFSGFPALIAPASLKLDLHRENTRIQCRFPALIAPASLKPTAMIVAHPHIVVFSGVNCAGLIEASI